MTRVERQRYEELVPRCEHPKHAQSRMCLACIKEWRRNGGMRRLRQFNRDIKRITSQQAVPECSILPQSKFVLMFGGLFVGCDRQSEAFEIIRYMYDHQITAHNVPV
jgi:hypothetical protein